MGSSAMGTPTHYQIWGRIKVAYRPRAKTEFVINTRAKDYK